MRHWNVKCLSTSSQLAGVLHNSTTVLSSLQAVEGCFQDLMSQLWPSTLFCPARPLLHWLLQVRPFVLCWPWAPTKWEVGLAMAAADLVHADATQVSAFSNNWQTLLPCLLTRSLTLKAEYSDEASRRICACNFNIMFLGCLISCGFIYSICTA